MTESKTVQIAPMAALRLATAERDFLRNHALLAEHTIHELTGQVKAQAAEIERLTKLLPPDADGVDRAPKKPAPKSPALAEGK